MPIIVSNHFEWIEVENYRTMNTLAVSIFEQQLIRKPNSVLGLATGGSPIGFYEMLVQRHAQGNFSFAQAKTFNLDEYVGVGPSHPTSYHSYMDRYLFAHIDLPNDQRYLPNGLADELDAECERYEQAIASSGGVDLQLLGIGVNGHIGFNEPGTSFHSKTHVVELADATREQNAIYFNSKKKVPTKAITMGIQTILQAKQIVLFAFGENKVNAIKRLKYEDVSEEFPASSLKYHPHVTVFHGE